MATARRLDIQGLRTVAVGSVVAFHLRPEWFPGGFAGVDVFFVISGYLITGGLLRGAREGRIGLAEFWSRRIRRLMPAATVVIVATLLSTVVLLPAAFRGEHVLHALASALSLENWLLASRTVSYLQATSLPSPFQHYWSLSVEEQFYVVWPLVAAGVTLAAVRLRRSPEHAIGIAAVALGLVSLGWSVVSTVSQADIAYLSTLTRAWELLIGAALAVWLPGRALRPGAARALLVVGIVLIVGSVALLDDATPFPGWAALAPTLGAAAALAAGATPFTSYLRSLLECRPVTYLGDISYSLYLWHWPVVVAVCAAAGSLTVPRVALVPVLALSVLLAALSKRFVEDPFLVVRPIRGAHRDPAPVVRRRAFVMAASMLAVTGATATVVSALPVEQVRSTAPTTAYAGASVLNPSFDQTTLVDEAVPPLPTLQELQTTEPQLRPPCLAPASSEELTTCRGATTGGSRTVLLAGDSHSALWMPAFEELGRLYDWDVVVAAKQSCPLIWLEPDEDPNGFYSGPCRTWNAQLRDTITTLRPDLVVTGARNYAYPHQSPTGPVSYDRATGEAYARQYRFVEELDIPVVVMRQLPFFPGFSAPECLAMPGASVADCNARMGQARTVPESRIDAALRAFPDASAIDVSPYICQGEHECAAVVGNVVTYRDDNHLTPSFAKSLAWVIERDLRTAHPELFEPAAL